MASRWEKKSDEIVRIISRKDLDNIFNSSISLGISESALFVNKKKIIGYVKNDTVKLGGLFGNRSLSKTDTIILIDISIKHAECHFSGFVEGQKVLSSVNIQISISNPLLFFHSYLNRKSLDHDFVLFTWELASLAENNIISNVFEQQIRVFGVDKIKKETETQSTIQNALEKEVKNYFLSYGVDLVSFDLRWSFGNRRGLHSASVHVNDSSNIRSSSELVESANDNFVSESRITLPVTRTRNIFPSKEEDSKKQIKPDCINFTLTTSSIMAPGNDYEIAVWAYLEQQQQEMFESARDFHETDNIIKKSKKSVPVERKTHIRVHLEIPDFKIYDPEDTIYWDGEVANATFMVNVPSNLPFGQYKGKLRFLVKGLQIARLDFKLTVGTEEKSVSKIPANLIIINRAFASYASEDRNAVLGRIHGMQKLNPNIDVFIDLVSLHSGEDWYKRLKEEIDNRDIFYLFWSEAASHSEWVEKEWRLALESKGIEFISPVPLVSPEKVKPPRELESRHFNDWILAYMGEN